MGMFDWFSVKMTLPGDPPADLSGWQTKDTPAQALDTYELREDGTLWYHDPVEREGWTVHRREWRFLGDYTGEICFYTNANDDGHTIRSPSLWWEYGAYFVNGRLLHIHLKEYPTKEQT